MSAVDLTVDQGVATITLARPDFLNALNLQLATEFLATVRAVGERRDVDVLILAARGRAFCAGGDVAEMAASGDPSRYLAALTADVHEALALVRELPIPVVAKVQGAVAGGGLGVMLSADVVICADHVRFTPAYGSLGLSPDCGATALVPEAIGRRRAKELFLLGHTLDAATACDWGLVSETVPAARLDQRTAEIVGRLRAPGRDASAAVLRLLATDSGAHRTRMDAEASSISELAATPLAGERIARFVSR